MRDWLAEAARARPEGEAVAADDGSLTYAELDERVDRRARELAGAGVRAGDRVAVTHPPGLAFAELLHALPRLRAVLEPGPPTDRPLPAAAAAGPATLRTTLDPDAVHTVIRTSGTTGEPKPVELTYANHLASAIASADALGVEPGDRWLCPLPLHHVGGLNVLVRSAINATAVVLHGRFDAERVRATLEAGEVDARVAGADDARAAARRRGCAARRGCARSRSAAGRSPRSCSTGRARRTSRWCPSTG